MDVYQCRETVWLASYQWREALKCDLTLAYMQVMEEAHQKCAMRKGAS